MARATRTRRPTNYAADPYKDLDVGGSGSGSDADIGAAPPHPAAAAAASPPPADGDGDGDGDATPGLSDSATSDSGSATSDSAFSASARRPQAQKPKPRPRRPPRPAPPAPGSGARLHRPHKFRVNRPVPPGTRRRDRPTADADAATPDDDNSTTTPAATPAALRPPDPSVKITYRPGFIKSTGKRERIVTAYGADTETLVKAVKVRDTFIGLPAVPERACLGYTPFWRDGQDVHVDVGAGQQREVRVEYYQTPLTGDGDGDGEQQGGGPGVEGYLPTEDGAVVRCIIGPQTAQKIITFKRFGIHDLSGTGKRGYILNAGGQIVGLDWATNRPEGCQYLAISTAPPAPLRANAPSAFDRDPSPSSLQIWRFPASPAGSPAGAPSLSLVLCHEWGPARSLHWCPIPRKPSENPRDLGMLAAVYRDGNVRVLRIVLPHDDSEGDCVFLKLHTPAFELTLPDTILTTTSWLSTSALISGCANGFIAAWTLLHPSTPYLYHPLHQTYIAALSTCYPSSPHHIVTASLDGYCRLTSLLDPAADTVVNNRSRIAPTTIAWIDHIHAAVSCEEGAWVKFYPLRRFFSATTCSKHSGVVAAVAASVAHCCVLSAGSEGEAVLCNPVRRTFHGKIKNYLQVWFQMEFSNRRAGAGGGGGGSSDPSSSGGGGGGSSGEGEAPPPPPPPTAPSGMWRMNEGFKLEEFETKSDKMKRRINNTALVHSTAYPIEAGVAMVCWNQNVLCGGWATAGMVCGLVRVEDVAIG